MILKYFAFISSLIVLELFHAPVALAWHDKGHITVALIANQEFEPSTQANAIAILKAAVEHTEGLPQFHKDLNAGVPGNHSRAKAQGDPLSNSTLF
jgi:hypothetical protein